MVVGALLWVQGFLLFFIRPDNCFCVWMVDDYRPTPMNNVNTNEKNRSGEMDSAPRVAMLSEGFKQNGTRNWKLADKGFGFLFVGGDALTSFQGPKP